MEFSDMRITMDEYFAILRQAWEKSYYFDGWDKAYHPEDLHINFETVVRSVGEGIISYHSTINSNYLKKKPKYNPDKKTVEDMKIQKAASSASGLWTAYNSMEYLNTFGDNV